MQVSGKLLKEAFHFCGSSGAIPASLMLQSQSATAFPFGVLTPPDELLESNQDLHKPYVCATLMCIVAAALVCAFEYLKRWQQVNQKPVNSNENQLLVLNTPCYILLVIISQDQ